MPKANITLKTCPIIIKRKICFVYKYLYKTEYVLKGICMY